jgi:hypothetical protein
VTDGAQAAEIVREALAELDYSDVDVEGTNQQQNVWVVDVTADGTAYSVYVDPVTQRTSSVHRAA